MIDGKVFDDVSQFAAWLNFNQLVLAKAKRDKFQRRDW
jgi:hypothetical protein